MKEQEAKGSNKKKGDEQESKTRNKSSIKNHRPSPKGKIPRFHRLQQRV